CGKPRACTPCVPLTERARSDIAQHLRRVGCLRNEHRRRRQMESQDVASATDMLGSRDERLRPFAEGTSVGPRLPGRGLPSSARPSAAYWPGVLLNLASTAAPLCIRFAIVVASSARPKSRLQGTGITGEERHEAKNRTC